MFLVRSKRQFRTKPNAFVVSLAVRTSVSGCALFHQCASVRWRSQGDHNQTEAYKAAVQLRISDKLVPLNTG